MSISEIINDPRTILCIVGDAVEEVGERIGRLGVTKIDTYEENGEMAPIVWFRIWRGDVLWKRIRGGSVAEIEYEPKGGSDAA
jgi:hypothetical protein